MSQGELLISFIAICAVTVATRTGLETSSTSNDKGVARPRLDSIDALRGLVMVIMALDHVRDFFTIARFEGTNLSRTTTAYFFTRWITHFCAPVFVFLAGTGAFLAGKRRTKKELSWLLLTRGLWLVIVELTLVRFALMFNLNYHGSFLQVIWVIGVSMMILAGMIFLPTGIVTICGLVIIAGHNLLDRFQPDDCGRWRWLWGILHGAVGPIPPNPPTVMQWHPGYIIIELYPLIPWIGVLLVGYGFGQLYLMEAEHRRKLLMKLGLGLTAAFIILRATNLYGDPHKWVTQKNAWFTFLSFINCEKYPPSLLFLLMTLGPAIVLLSFLETYKGKLSKPFIVYGRVPFLYYIVHFTLAHFLAVVFAVIKYGTSVLHQGLDPFTQPPPDWGYSLPIVYLIWISIVVSLYPLCAWFAGVKQRRRDAWLSYL